MANSTNRSATGAFEVNIFVPLSRKPSPSETARVCMANASDPELGSVMEFAAMISPRHIPGRYFSRCSSLPYFQIGTAQGSR